MDKNKEKRAARKESRAHDKSARKAYREDNPSVFGRMKLRFGRKKNN